jgi:aminoglycoside phosphotransferase (APT) family kinase protein
MNVQEIEPLGRLGIRRQQPDLVLAALRDNLLGMAGQIPDAALSGPLRFFGQLAGWAAATASVEGRAAEGTDRVEALRRRALELGVDGSTLCDLAEALAVAGAAGDVAAGAVLVELLAELKAVEEGPVASVPPAAGGAGGPDAEAFSDYLAARFGNGAHATAVTVVPGGYSKTTLLVDAVIDGVAQQIVFRQVPPGYSRDALKPEYDVLTAIWSPGMLVPEPLWIEEKDSVVGGPFFASRRSPGKPLGTVSGAGGAQVPAEVITDLAGFLAQLHAIDAGKLGSAPVLPMRNEAEIHAAIDDLVARSEASVGEPSPRLRAVLSWLHSHVPTTPVPSVVHGDPGFQNTLAENGRMSAALDWERAHVGDAAEDLAYVLPSVSEVSDWGDFLKAYEAAGGRVPDEANIRFYLVWQDVWRHVECARLGESFYSSGIFSSAIAGFVLGPQFLDSALSQAFPGPKENSR